MIFQFLINEITSFIVYSFPLFHGAYHSHRETQKVEKGIHFTRGGDDYVAGVGGAAGGFAASARSPTISIFYSQVELVENDMVGNDTDFWARIQIFWVRKTRYVLKL